MNFQGLVQDRKGFPLPDVLVIAWPKGKRGEAVAQARSGEDGRFLLPGLRPDRWTLLVEAGGLGTLETERQVPEDGKALLALESESRTLTGIVTDAVSRPQPGVQVAMGGPGLRWTRTARSDANGIFAMAGLGSDDLAYLCDPDQREILLDVQRGKYLPLLRHVSDAQACTTESAQTLDGMAGEFDASGV